MVVFDIAPFKSVLDKNSWDTSIERCFFLLLTRLLSLTIWLTHQILCATTGRVEDGKVSQIS